LVSSKGVNRFMKVDWQIDVRLVSSSTYLVLATF